MVGSLDQELLELSAPAAERSNTNKARPRALERPWETRISEQNINLEAGAKPYTEVHPSQPPQLPRKPSALRSHGKLLCGPMHNPLPAQVASVPGPGGTCGIRSKRPQKVRKGAPHSPHYFLSPKAGTTRREPIRRLGEESCAQTKRSSDGGGEGGWGRKREVNRFL